MRCTRPAPCKDLVIQITGIARGLVYTKRCNCKGSILQDCNSYRSISPGVAIACWIFHKTLKHYRDLSQKPFNCYWTISGALQLLQVYFTGPCNWILDYFTGALQVLKGYFTEPCNCYGLFHGALQVL